MSDGSAKRPARTILVVDDEPDVVEMISRQLVAAEFRVVSANDGTSGIEMVRKEAPALVVLDLMMPGLTGFEVCKVIRNDPKIAHTSILMLTSRGEEVDRIVGLELGADDFLTKPFSPRELLLRIKAILRRSSDPRGTQTQFSVGTLVFDSISHEVKVEGQLIDLTPTEYKLLKVLLERRGRVQNRESLLLEVWGHENAGIDTRTIDTHMRRLREKLGEASEYIETVRGFGYRIEG